MIYNLCVEKSDRSTEELRDVQHDISETPYTGRIVAHIGMLELAREIPE